MDNVTERITAIVDTQFGGNWAAAARAAGLRRTSMQKIKAGADPHVSTVRQLAYAWGVPVAWLLGDGGVGEDATVYQVTPPDPLTRYREATRLVLSEISASGMIAQPERAEWLITWLADAPPMSAEQARDLVALCLGDLRGSSDAHEKTETKR